MAGVVNIVTRDPPEKFKTALAAASETKNTRILQLDSGAMPGASMMGGVKATF